MKLLVFACLLAVSLAAPVATPDEDDDNLAVESRQEVTSFIGTPGVLNTQILSGSPVFQQNPVAYSLPVSFNQGAHYFAGAVPYSSAVPTVHEFKKIDEDDIKFVQHGYSAIAAPTVHEFKKIDKDDIKFVQHGYSAIAHGSTGVNVAVSPAITAYSAGQSFASPVIGSYHHGQAVVSPSVATYNVGHAVAAPAIATHAVAAPVQYHAAAVAPAIATYQHQAVVHEVKPVSVAVPSAITYEAAHTVQLAPKEINVPVQHQTVHVPVERRVVYGTETYVAGSTTTVHKPKIIAPAISAPNVFVAKTRQAAPEVTVHHSEVTVEKKSPNFVAAPYDGGVVVEKAAPHVNQIDVPTPVDVPHPVNVPTPYTVQVAHPVKVKSTVNPVVNVDVHSVQTENLVTPIEYTRHHHVATAPVVAAPAVAYQAAPAVQYAASVPTAIAYGAAAAPTSFAVQGVAAQGLVTQGVATHGFANQGIIAGGQAIGYAAVPAGQNNIYGSSSQGFVHGGFAGVPSASFTGQKIEQGGVRFVGVGGSQTGTAPYVTTYSAATPGVGQQQVVIGTPNFVAAPLAQVSFGKSSDKDE